MATRHPTRAEAPKGATGGLQLRLHLLVRRGTYGQRASTACRIELTQARHYNASRNTLAEYVYSTTRTPEAVTCGNCIRTRAYRAAWDECAGNWAPDDKETE